MNSCSSQRGLEAKGDRAVGWARRDHFLSFVTTTFSHLPSTSTRSPVFSANEILGGSVQPSDFAASNALLEAHTEIWNQPT